MHTSLILFGIDLTLLTTTAPGAVYGLTMVFLTSLFNQKNIAWLCFILLATSAAWLVALKLAVNGGFILEAEFKRLGMSYSFVTPLIGFTAGAVGGSMTLGALVLANRTLIDRWAAVYVMFVASFVGGSLGFIDGSILILVAFLIWQPSFAGTLAFCASRNLGRNRLPRKIGRFSAVVYGEAQA